MGYKRSDIGIVCKDCEDRYLGCHDYCLKYQERKNKAVKEKKERQSAARVESEWINYRATRKRERGV